MSIGTHLILMQSYYLMMFTLLHMDHRSIILAQANQTFNYLSNGDDGLALVYGSNPGSPVDLLQELYYC